MALSAIEVGDLTKDFGGLRAVDRVSLRVASLNYLMKKANSYLQKMEKICYP